MEENGKSKWLYNGVYYDNVKLVRALIHDYVIVNNIESFKDIPEEIRNFKMYSHELIIQEGNELLNTYSYTKINANGMDLFVRSICQRWNTDQFLTMMKRYFDYTVNDVISSDEE